MELALNLAWVLLALSMLLLWLRISPRAKAGRRIQFVALALIIVILLPAISMTDDLLAAQNPAEVDTYIRRDHDRSMAHLVFPEAIALVVLIFAGLAFDTPRRRPQSTSLVPLPASALSSIDTRPPPAA